MIDFFRIDNIALRHFIFYELLNRKPVFESYENFCEKLGDDVIEYREFEYWFYRFYQGKLDFSYERSSDSISLVFSELPIEIIGKVVEKLDLMSRLILRKVSRNLRNVIDTQKIENQQLYITINDNFTQLGFNIFNFNPIKYIQDESDCIVEYQDRKKIIKGGNHMEIALKNDLNTFMDHEKLHLELLKVSFDLKMSPEETSNAWDEIEIFKQKFVDLEIFFKSLHSKLHVTKLEINGKLMDPVMLILPYLSPAHLQKIHLSTQFQNRNVLQKVMNLEQWNQAKELETNGMLFPFSIDSLFHLSRFHVFYRNITASDVLKIRNILFKSPKFEYCLLDVSMDCVDICSFYRLFGPPISHHPRVFQYPVPQTKNQYFEIKIESGTVKIERKFC